MLLHDKCYIYLVLRPLLEVLAAVLEAEGAVASPVGVADAEVVLLVDGVELSHLLLGELDDREVVRDAGGGDRLGDDVHTRAVGLERDKDVRRLDVVLLSELENDRVLAERRVVRAEGRVRGDDDALAAAELNDLLLRAGPEQHDQRSGRG
jgi:hypothetical protein